MGDPFSIAVGALQVAEVGFKLCDTLHSSVRDFKNAEKDVKRVASEVKTASWALKQLGALLQQDEAIKRTKPGAISEASTALNQCSETFAEVQIILPASGGSASSISAAARFKWATRKSKVDALLANIKVISYAKEITSSTKDSATDQLDMRFQLETLIKSKNEAVRRYEELVKSLNQTRLDDDSANSLELDSGSQSLNTELELVSLPSDHAPPTLSNANVKGSASEIDKGDKNGENHDLTRGLTEALAECHKAAFGLTESLHIVHIQWRAVQKYDEDDIQKNYQLTDRAMRALRVAHAKRSALDNSSKMVQDKKPTFRCDCCPKVFESYISLRLHKPTHIDQSPFACTVCRKGFTLLQELYRHEVSKGCQKKYHCKGTLASDKTWGCGGEYAGPVEFYRHIRSEGGQLCIRPLWEEELAKERKSLEKEDGTRQQEFQTDEIKDETELPKNGQACPMTERELPTRLTDIHPALLITTYMSTVPSPDGNEARDHDAKTEHDSDEEVPAMRPPPRVAFRKRPHSVRKRLKIARGDDKDLRGSSSSSGDHELLPRKDAPSAHGDLLLGDSPNPRQENNVNSPLTPSDMNFQDTEDPVDALLREWTTVQVC